MEEVLFKSEEPKSRGDVAQFLRQLADKVEAGEVTLRQGDQEQQVQIPQNLILETKLERETKRDGEKLSLEVELEWRPGGGSAKSGVELA
ncbi:amphi-Trp domain-containing protein [Desulfonatronum thioautotrophicum]|uniref:amphi-Trp domain-containing protein n=1 Tax=Desulfonatronum thioautotrophicum TaxID=617001 RepID=UPI0005EADD64|nr:amphi-Trp domain-containing protein [Desulfonatronum thioautotrophicum]